MLQRVVFQKDFDSTKEKVAKILCRVKRPWKVTELQKVKRIRILIKIESRTEKFTFKVCKTYKKIEKL